MSLSGRTKTILGQAVADLATADELVDAIDAGAAGATPSFTTVTTTGNVTVGGDVKIASGHVLKINNIQVVGAQQASIAKNTVTPTTGSLPTPGGSTTIADTATPTVVELLDYCTELKAKVDAILDVLDAHGLTA